MYGFFYDRWLDSCGHSRPAYCAVTEVGGHVTGGSTLAQAIYMAHDLIACFTLPSFDMDEEEQITSAAEAASQIELSVDHLAAEMDIAIEHLQNGFWVRKGDPLPTKNTSARIRMQERAFCLLYRSGLNRGTAKYCSNGGSDARS